MVLQCPTRNVTKSVENDGFDRSEIGQVSLASQVAFLTSIPHNMFYPTKHEQAG